MNINEDYELDNECDITPKEKVLLIKELKDRHIQHRKFVKELEIQKLIDEEEKEKKLNEEKMKSPKNPSYIDRRFKKAKFMVKEQNERMKKMMNKVDSYMKRIEDAEKFDEVQKLKNQAEKEYKETEKKVDKETLGNIVGRLSKLNKNAVVERENILQKRIEREKSKSKIISGKTVGKQIIKNILPNILLDKIRPITGIIKKNNLFQEEDNFEGTNAIPNLEENSNSEMTNKRRISSAKIINNNTKNEVEMELRKIIKDGSDINSLINFKNKYKWYDISAYLHKAQMKFIKNKQKDKNNEDFYYTKTTQKLTRKTKEKIEDENSINISSYVQSCLYNNSDYIQSYLLQCKDDSEVFQKINEKDEFMRKGIIYLILNGNYSMIKLTLMSGLIISDTQDKYKRNSIHYCAMTMFNDILEVIIKCVIYEYKEDLDGMIKFLEKVFNDKSLQDQKGLSEEEKNEILIKIENSIENKEDNINNENNQEEEDEIILNNKLNIFSKKGKSNSIDELSIINTIIVTNDINFYYEKVKKVKISLNNLINETDVDNRTPLHLACINNNFEMIKVLLYYKAKTDIRDHKGNKPIDYCTSDTIIQYILIHSKNIQSKMNAEKTSLIKLLTGTVKKEIKSDSNNIDQLLDVKNLKYIPDNKLNEFTQGYENNSYLILSVIYNKFETFCFLVDKNVNILFNNSNGWNIIHFIILHKRFKFLYYLFIKKSEKSEKSDQNINNFDENEISIIYDKLKIINYETSDIYHSKGGLNSLGQSFISLDSLTNNQINSLFMSIDSKNENIFLFKLISNLLIKREILIKSGNFFNEKLSSLEIILNRKYDKTNQTLLIKSVDKKSLELIEYLTKEINDEYILYDIESNSNLNINIYETDKNSQNVLHYIIKNSLDEKFMKYFIRLDSDKNILKSMKDKFNKIPQDYDNSRKYSQSSIHIWEAAKMNDHILLEKIITEGFYKIDEQTLLYKNTPLHLAAINCSDKSALSLIKNGCDISIKNNKNLSALDLALQNKTNKLFIKKFKAISNKEITEFVQLESYGKNNLNSTLNLTMNNSTLSTKNVKMTKKLNEIISKIKNYVEKRNLNFKKIFEKLDENKNGKLEGYEFESLFTILDIEGISRDDVLLLMSYLDSNMNGLIEYEEFIKILD